MFRVLFNKQNTLNSSVIKNKKESNINLLIMKKQAVYDEFMM